jgi:hypothetical protein
MTPAKPNPPRGQGSLPPTVNQRTPIGGTITPPRPPRPTPAPPPIKIPPKPVIKTPPPPPSKPIPKPVPTPNPKSARAFNQQQQFAEMMPDLANRSPAYKRGGGVKSGGSVSKRADGRATKGKTKGRMI